MKRGKPLKLHCVRKEFANGNLRAHSSSCSSPCSSSSRVAVHRRSVRHRSQVPLLARLLRCVPSQPPQSRSRIGGVDADDGRDHTPSLNRSLRKTLLKMTLQTSWLYGIYSRLVQARSALGPMGVRGSRGTYSWKTSCPCSRCL